VDDTPTDEIVEVDDRRFIALTYKRVWPRYVVTWSVRQRAGEGDFPVTNGVAEELPIEGTAGDVMWGRVRDQALAEAQHAAEGAAPVAPRKGFFGRLLGR
jgi:hypothetical protein